MSAISYGVTPPGNPTSIDPGCAATGDVWQHTCANPDFTWSGATDGGCGVAGYHVYWGTAISGTTPSDWTTSAGYDAPAVPSGVPYYLRVQTEDQVGNQAQTGPWTFSVDTGVAPSLGVTKYYYLGAIA